MCKEGIMKKTVLITGSNGYIGRHIVKNLQNTNLYNVVCVDYKQQETSETTIQYDIIKDCKKETLFNDLKSPDILIHLAWRDGFNHNATSHIEDLSSHFNFIKNLIDNGTKQVIVAGSFREYGRVSGKVTEDFPCKTDTLYTIAKNALRESLEIYTKNKDICFQWLRFFTPYGDDKYNNSILSKILSWEQEGKTSFPFTDGLEEYDYIHVDELAEQVVNVVKQQEIQGIINICSGKSVRLKDVVEKFLKENSLKIKPEYGAFKRRDYDSNIIYGDNQKIQNIIRRNNEK